MVAMQIDCRTFCVVDCVREKASVSCVEEDFHLDIACFCVASHRFCVFLEKKMDR